MQDHANIGIDISEESENKTLPIDMRFNDGHLISITLHSVLFVLSSIGMLKHPY